MKTKKLFLFAAIITAVLSACKGDKGDTGPQGAQGNANVQSYTYTVNPSNWYALTYEWDTDLGVSAVSQSILDRGTVNVFMSTDGGSNWLALPFSFTGAEFNFLYKVGTVTVAYSWDNGVLPSSAPNTCKFKVIVVPGSIVRNNPHIDWNNYSEVRARFNLND